MPTPLPRIRTAMLCVLVLLPCCLRAQWLFDIETGAVVANSYNRVRIPGAGGTEFNIPRDFGFEAQPYFRARIGRTFANRHTVSILLAPLSIRQQGTAPFDIRFQDRVFAAGTDLTARYQFNSWRITYRYDFVTTERVRLGAGFTAKLRDAAVQLLDDQGGATKTDVGFVPLLHLYFSWAFAGPEGTTGPRLRLLVEADGLAAPQGRAVDAFAGLRWQLGRYGALKAGYRILEGGADNDEVYNFTMLHYAALGLIVRVGG